MAMPKEKTVNYCVIPEKHDIGFLLILNYGLNGLKEHQPKDYHRGIALCEEINRQRGIENPPIKKSLKTKKCLKKKP